MDVADRVQRAVVDVFGGQRVVCFGGVLAGTVPLVDELRRAGTERILLVPTSIGTGQLPTGDDLEIVVQELPPSSGATEQFRREEQLGADPPRELVDAIARFAGPRPLLLAQMFSAVRAVGPFPAYGARRAAWVALEDKTRADELFDAAGVPRPPSAVVPACASDLLGAHARLDRGAGTVWAGDAREGFNGGGEYVRWVRDATSERSALEFFRHHCDNVRVAPFVEGVPASVHGFVTRDGVAAFRPVELVTLRAPTAGGLKFAGACTLFDPAERDREVMRASVRALGATLRDRVEFRGSFTIDGICGRDGFVATECNPRAGGALGYVAKAASELSYALGHRVASEGGLEDLDVVALEERIVSAADRTRWGGAWTITTPGERASATTEVAITGDEHGYRVARDGDAVDASLAVGPGPAGAFVRFVPDPVRTPIGPSIAPRAVAAFRLADEEFGTRLGPLAAALSAEGVAPPS